MNIDPFTLIQKGDIVQLNDMGLSYFEPERYANVDLEVINTRIDHYEKGECTKDNDGIERPNCTCYRFFDLRQIGTDIVLKDAMFNELTLKEIKKNVDSDR